ncbi:MAG: SUMF1/EgtB/PvdO family nonheme iron enzyme [Myxococcales bacterium]|nr:SUMF1/EgtB/PvdO family nonheme iron enzyme [Myxococcales bacterium]
MSRACWRPLSTTLALAALAFAGAGCSVDPYCLTCADGDVEVEDSGVDARVFDGELPDVPVDATDDDGGCRAEEECNGRDDDCDGFIDEGFDLDNDPAHCGGCNARCAPFRAFPICEEGVCRPGDCDVGWVDLDGDAETGCEYRCTPTHDDDAICDLRDNDCDGRIDEDVDLQNDARNCGRCGRVCRFPNAMTTCMAGACVIEACEPGFENVDGRAENGCEYACVPADPPIEICNLRDDDCDGVVDEGNPGGDEACGSDVGACMRGVTACRAGRIVCEGEVTPIAELCNGLDDNCNGTVDEGNPEGGRLCGERRGQCEQGREVCMGGALQCMGAIGPSPELCNGLDDDCDGVIDEGNPEGGMACGETTGACTAGEVTCVNGALLCLGGTTPRPELCNGLDDDCDGLVDEGDPESGGLCGTDVGACQPGRLHCVGGGLVCQGAITPVAELCNGFDDDCDGEVDEGNPGGGGACGDTTGECRAGTLMCRFGAFVCEGFTAPSPELCNGLDDDCDGRVDEDFDFLNDPRHCGGCGVACTLTNAAGACSAGSCVIAACAPGFYDIDGDPTNGCEYGCDFRGPEICNGVDDDCDGVVDEGLTVPGTFCSPLGVCAGTVARCGGAGGWVCDYPATYQETETRCDGLDNDCDGRTDEAFPLAGTGCSTGIGACRGLGSFVCNAAGDGVFCNATPAAAPADEACNGLDDDCDGFIDEVGLDDPATPWRDAITVDAFDTVVVPRASGGTMRIMQYEASRPDATSSSQGALATLACSRPGVLPWTSVTWTQARDACCAMNAGGTCPGASEVGWRLCGSDDWQRACQGTSGTCDWAYQSSCSMSQPTVCNGKEVDADPLLPGNQDAIARTGAFASCNASYAAGRVYDMSGNVREWTATPAGAGIYEQRGGAYTTIEMGRACDFDFTVAEQTFAFPNTGFRCCHY